MWQLRSRALGLRGVGNSTTKGKTVDYWTPTTYLCSVRSYVDSADKLDFDFLAPVNKIPSGPPKRPRGREMGSFV